MNSQGLTNARAYVMYKNLRFFDVNLWKKYNLFVHERCLSFVLRVKFNLLTSLTSF